MAAEICSDAQEAALSLITEIKRRVPGEKYVRFINALQRHRPGGGGQPESLTETVMTVEDILEGQGDLIQKFYRVVYGSPIDVEREEGCKAAVDFINRIGRRNRGLQKTVLKLFDSYNRNAIGEDDLRREVVELLKRNPDVLDGIGRFLPVTEATPISVVVPQGEKPYSRKIGDRGDQEAAVEEHRVSKRAKPVNGNNPQREEISELIFENREKFPPSSLYRYSTGGDDFREEISRSLSQLIPPAAAAAVAEEKEERRVANREREKEWAKSLISRSKRLTPSYLPLPPETKSKSKSKSSSILNTSCVSVAAEECDFAVGAERRRRLRVDPRVEKLNRMEDDLYEADMAKRYLMSMVEYVEEGERGDERKEFRFKSCVEAMYGGAVEMPERKEDRESFDRAVKTRLYQKIGELSVQRLKMTAKAYL
ncbi:unnamed protein product [Linum tenue]|uniref:Histone deacetylase interacting domain-containing protein n=1 Tax=Linum tenue TaxID=586396 RepID=A0AAV0QQ37_9ROSI|nr:unnamed protein product [Linum tenue]